MLVELIVLAVMIIIIAVSAFIGVKKGFIKMVAGFVEYIIAFFIAFAFCNKLAVYVKRIPFIARMITDVEMPEFAEGGTLTDKLKVIFEYLGQGVLRGEDVSESAKAVGMNYLAEAISITISFIALFAVAILLQKLIVFILDKFAQAPGLKQANGLFGFLFGALCGSFWTWLLTNIFVYAALPILISEVPTIFNESLYNSKIIVFFMKMNPVSILFNAISWLADKLSGI
ncbi:MAG: CvpA family protein [Clostridia bacterium]|nr:CvpA family protein [Clostridia bacterium]